MRTPLAAVLLLATAAAACAADSPTAPPGLASGVAGAAFPDVIELPAGFWPEGIASGRGTTLYVGSLATGALLRLDARTGAAAELVPPQAGRELVGVAYDVRTDRLFVAGGFSGQAFVFDAATGATLAVYQLGDPAAGPTLVNDVVVVNDAVYFTDSFRPVLYRLPLGAGGALPIDGAPEELPLGGDFVFVPGSFVAGNANGIVATPDGRRLIVVNSTTATLYAVDPQTGTATAIDLGGVGVAGDGLLLVGHTLYVVEGERDRVAVVRLSRDHTTGTVVGALTDPDLAFPSTVARQGGALYVVNARFDVPPGPDVAYQVVRLSP